MSDHFVEIKFPQQKKYSDDSIAFPLVLSPSPATTTAARLRETVRAQKPYLQSLLLKAGAVLFRGFDDVKTAQDFNDVVDAFGYEELPYLGGAASRTHVVGRVYTANESPPADSIPLHHELAQVPESQFPSKLLFFCEVEPGSGGESPLVLSHIVYNRMKQKHPEFVEQLEQHGLIYTRVAKAQDDPSSYIGRSWKSTFFTDDKNVAEERAAKVGMKLQWTDAGGAKIIMGPVPGVKYDKIRQRKIWCNNIAVAYGLWKDAGIDHLNKAVTFGNGKLLPADIFEACVDVLEEESVAIPWQKGDVLLVDNWAVLHGRRSYEPPRRVLASLCK